MSIIWKFPGKAILPIFHSMTTTMLLSTSNIKIYLYNISPGILFKTIALWDRYHYYIVYWVIYFSIWGPNIQYYCVCRKWWQFLTVKATNSALRSSYKNDCEPRCVSFFSDTWRSGKELLLRAALHSHTYTHIYMQHIHHNTYSNMILDSRYCTRAGYDAISDCVTLLLFITD